MSIDDICAVARDMMDKAKMAGLVPYQIRIGTTLYVDLKWNMNEEMFMKKVEFMERKLMNLPVKTMKAEGVALVCRRLSKTEN